MAELAFETLTFKEEGEKIRVNLLRLFYLYLERAALQKISPFKIKNNRIVFPNIPQEKAERKFSLLLGQALSGLKNSLNNNPAVYIHQNSGIPLMGSLSFGLVYRNTSVIEIRPVTSCNLNCVYCSLGEGLSSKKTDFVVEKDYLVKEFKKLRDWVGEEVEAHINCHGEPFLYDDLLPLIKDLNELEEVHTVSLNTNGTLLNKETIEKLAEFPKLRLNITLNTLNPQTAQKMAGCPYNLSKVVEAIEYALKKKVKVLLAPLLLPGCNDQKMEELVKFAKKHNLTIGIQNFLTYKTGRNPVRPWPWPKFQDFLKELEKKHQAKLLFSPADFSIHYTKKLEKPFGEGDTVQAVIGCPGRFKDSRIAIAKNRTISLFPCLLPLGKKVRIKITHDKHNIFVGKVV